MADGGPFGEWYEVSITLTHRFTLANPMPKIKPPSATCQTDEGNK